MQTEMLSIQAFGKMINQMDMGSSNFQMGTNMKVTLKMGSNMDKELLHGPTGWCTKASFEWDIFGVKVFSRKEILTIRVSSRKI